MEYIDVHSAAKKWDMTERRVTSLCRDGRIIGAKKIGKFWYVPNTATKPLDARTREYTEKSNESVNTERIGYTEHGGDIRVKRRFEEIYRKPPESVEFTPYRICPIGAHIDHQLGCITGFAIDRGVYIAYGPKQNGIIEIQSLQFPKRAQWHVLSVPAEKQGDWADHIRGATLALALRYPIRIGLCAVIDGELPIGGLSSSAAVIITYLNVLCKINGINLSAKELIEISKESENAYVGVSCGKLDQSCEIYCKKDHLLYMDMKDDSYELVPVNPNMKPYKIAIIFSGVERSLANTSYNTRVDEAKSAAYALMSYASMTYGKFADTYLRDVPYEVYKNYGDRLPEPWARRAAHWYGEMDRVERGVEAWRKGDIEEFGRLCLESGYSSIYNWEAGSKELKALFEIIGNTKGVYGGRFSGAGFKGCCIAIIDPEQVDSIRESIAAEYLKRFPELEGRYSFHVCNTADGVKLKK